MGFFSSVEKYVNQRTERANEEYEKALRQDLYGICRHLKGKSMTSIGVTGTIRALKQKASEAEDNELKQVFIQTKKQNIRIGYYALAPELERRGYLETDSEGRYHQTDEW